MPRPRAVMPCSGGAPKGSERADSGDRAAATAEEAEEEEEELVEEDALEGFSGEGERSIDELYLSEELEWLEMDEEIDDEEPSPSWRTSP